MPSKIHHHPSRGPWITRVFPASATQASPPPPLCFSHPCSKAGLPFPLQDSVTPHSHFPASSPRPQQVDPQTCPPTSSCLHESPHLTPLACTSPIHQAWQLLSYTFLSVLPKPHWEACSTRARTGSVLSFVLFVNWQNERMKVCIILPWTINVFKIFSKQTMVCLYKEFLAL